jgi:hypothetical protein
MTGFQWRGFSGGKSFAIVVSSSGISARGMLPERECRWARFVGNVLVQTIAQKTVLARNSSKMARLGKILIHVQTLDLRKGPVGNVLSFPNLKFSLDKENPHWWRCPKARRESLGMLTMHSGAFLQLLRAATSSQSTLFYALVLLCIACSAGCPQEKSQ